MAKCYRCKRKLCELCAVKILICCICFHKAKPVRRKCEWCEERKYCDYCVISTDGCCLCMHERKMRSEVKTEPMQLV